jgi:FAD/FMN-containing dehydrogenases
VLGRELGKHGQMLALDPYGGLSRTVGGVLACGRAAAAFRYGTGRDLLLGARFVQADGTVTWGGSKVVKSVTGYDIPSS